MEPIAANLDGNRPAPDPRPELVAAKNDIYAAVASLYPFRDESLVRKAVREVLEKHDLLGDNAALSAIADSCHRCWDDNVKHASRWGGGYGSNLCSGALAYSECEKAVRALQTVAQLNELAVPLKTFPVSEEQKG